MLLKEAVEKYEGKTIRIGASSGFIYIGPADMNKVEIAARLERLKAEKELKKALDEMVSPHDVNFLIRLRLSLATGMRARLDKNERIRKGLIEEMAESIKPAKRKTKEKQTPDKPQKEKEKGKFKGGRILNPLEIARGAVENFIATEDRYQAQMFTAYSKVKDYAERMSPWIAISERPVKEVYKSIDPSTKGDVIIIISGKENGDYWFEEEYKRAHSEC